MCILVVGVHMVSPVLVSAPPPGITNGLYWGMSNTLGTFHTCTSQCPAFQRGR